jgi:hypothetical protein
VGKIYKFEDSRNSMASVTITEDQRQEEYGFDERDFIPIAGLYNAARRIPDKVSNELSASAYLMAVGVYQFACITAVACGLEALAK